MKNLFKSILFIAAAAMTFSACNKTETEIPQNEEDFNYTFILGSPETRSLLSSDENGKFGSWENGDRLGTIVGEANPGYSYVKLGTPVTFSIYKKGGLEEGETIYAYYPYNNSTTSTSEIAFEIPESQNQAGEVFDFDAMPMVAEGFVVPAELASEDDQTPVGEINLVNLGSVIDFQVYSSDATFAGETVLSVELEASTAIAGSFTKDITSVVANTESTLAISGFTAKDVITTVSNAPSLGADRANAAHVYMVIAPVTGVTGSVIVTTNKAVYTYNLATAQTFKRAGLKSFGLNLGTCQNRVASETNTAIFVFNTTDGIQSLGLDLPAASAGTTVERVVSDCIVLMGNVASGSTAPRVWNSNGTYNFRVNKNNTITFSVSEGTIKKITFDAGSKFNLTVADGTLSGTTWEGAASTVVFTNTDADRTDINTITVTYTGGVAPADPVTLIMSDIVCDDAEQNENSLTFSWSEVENATGYQVSTDGGNTYGDPQEELSYTWTGLAAGRQYTIYVKAVGDGISYYTSEAKSQSAKTKESDVPVENPSVGDVLFSTDFGTTAMALSAYTGGSSYNDASIITYTASDASYVRIDTGSAGNMTSANLFLGGKNGGSGLTATISGIKTYGAKKVTVSWAANNTSSTLTVTESETEGVKSESSASNSATFVLSGEEETISLVFTTNSKSNTRVDDVEVVFSE